MSNIASAAEAPRVLLRAPQDDAAEGHFTHHGFWAPGIRLFRQLHFGAKAALIATAVFVPMIALLAWQMVAQGELAFHDRMNATRQHVEIAHGVIASAYEQEKSGKLSREQAQQLARMTLSQLRYDGQEYFWINDFQPRMVMHPFKPELDGKDIGGIKDPNGFALFKAFVDTVRRHGEGFVSYQWPMPGRETPVDKISYVKGFQPWGWIVGSGIYTGDVRESMMRRVAWNSSLIGALLLIVGYLFVSFYRVMDGGLKETRRHLRLMTDGDLTMSPEPGGRDETAQLMLDLRAMQDSLGSMVWRVRSASEDIVHSTSEIASGALDLSKRTEQAAANLEQSAASMQEITSTVSNTSRHTTEVAQMAQHNAEVAAEGGRAMREVITTMDGIRASSSRIGEIVGTIDGIAFQTNILALNAAVEAARAGEQGRGFAVVAGEVRILARRSAEAAKEIKSLIVASVDQVRCGTEIVQKAGATIDDIVASSQNVNALLDQIATGSREQDRGIGQIGQAVQDLDRMTQQNAALVQETAASASAMKDQARGLVDAVARFRLPDRFQASQAEKA